jgi:DNA-binding LacI/PurR family transcriptional regulator
MIREDCVDAIILFGTPGYSWYDKLDTLGIPVIEVNTNRRDEKGCITYGEEEACRTAVQYFADRKRTVPLYVFRDSPRKHYSLAVRKKSFTREAEEAGLSSPLICELLEDQGAEEVSTFVSKNQEIDSILLYSSNLAPQVYAGISREGFTPGTDLSILGFGHAEMAKVMSPPLSTLTVDVRELGITIIERICAQLDGNDPAGPWIIPYELTERKT